MSGTMLTARPYAWLTIAASDETCLKLIDGWAWLIPLKCEPVALCKTSIFKEVSSLRLTKRPYASLPTSATVETWPQVVRAWGEKVRLFVRCVKSNIGAEYGRQQGYKLGYKLGCSSQSSVDFSTVFAWSTASKMDWLSQSEASRLCLFTSSLWCD